MVETIDAMQLKRMMDAGERFTLVDALPAERYTNIHLPGAINIPAGEIAYRAGSELPDRSARIVVYSGSSTCPFSITATRVLEQLGYTQVVRFADGLAGWQDAGLLFEVLIEEDGNRFSRLVRC